MSRSEWKLEKPSFYNYAYTKYEQKVIKEERKPDVKEYQIAFIDNLKCFPLFPDIDLISGLSYENYERKACKVNLVFLPFKTLYIKQKKNPLIFSYANKTITFEKDHIRLIRKISESSDNDHALVLCCDDSGIYCFNGIIKVSRIDRAFSDYYYISITGQSQWSARCKNFNLFDFKNGLFCDFNNSTNYNLQIQDVKDYFVSCDFKIDCDLLQIILDTIIAQNHGTSFVVFKNKDMAISEAKRLCNAQRGLAAKKPLKYREFVKCIPLLTKIDGGLLLDSDLTCYAYGVIYDGVVRDFFEGSLANGSRFNSAMLYTYNLNNPKNRKRAIMNPQLMKCLGVVFSDDGGVKIANM